MKALLHKYEQTVITVVYFFYGVGVAGLSFNSSAGFFRQLIPFALLFSCLLLAFFHQQKPDKKSQTVFSSIALLAYFTEVAGVNCGCIFGSYKYGESLGISLFHTPLIIGLNWLLLVYTCSSMFEKMKINTLAKIILPAALMVVYDIILEQVAPKLDMWSWKNGEIPLQNYVAWFVLAALFNSLVVFFKIRTENRLSKTILTAQFLFFVALLILSA